MESFSNYIVNISNLKHNLKLIKNKLKPNVKVCAMVKADAYGHGLKDVCKALSGADFFGVASVGEAKLIRKFDAYTNVLVVGTIDLKQLLWCALHDVSVEVSSVEELNNYIKILDGNCLKVHIKVNTGLNRIGVTTLKEFKQMLKIIKQNSNVVLEGIFTHFATKFNDVQFLIKQHNLFLKFVEYVDTQKVIVHCCNSFASIMFPCFGCGMVRCGFNLYGWQNDCGLPFKPVLNIKSKLVFVHNVKKGESVGYDRTFVTNKNSKIGVVPVGYADGLDRRLSNNFSLLVNGEFVKIVGNICMDVCLLDLTGVDCKVGDEVVLIGESCGNKLTPQTYADVLGTSPYEILLKFRYSRMNRVLIE